MSVMPTISWARASGAALAAALVSAAAMADVGRQAGDAFDLAHPAVRAFTDRDGLPQNTVHGIAKDTLGYLWVATQDGAARWNGREWLTIDMPDRDVSNYIRTIVAAQIVPSAAANSFVTRGAVSPCAGPKNVNDSRRGTRLSGSRFMRTRPPASRPNQSVQSPVATSVRM